MKNNIVNIYALKKLKKKKELLREYLEGKVMYRTLDCSA